MPRHAPEGLRGVSRRDVADVELAVGEHGVTAIVLGEVGSEVEHTLGNWNVVDFCFVLIRTQ